MKYGHLQRMIDTSDLKLAQPYVNTNPYRPHLQHNNENVECHQSRSNSLVHHKKEKENKKHILIYQLFSYQKTIHEITLVDAVAEEAAYDYNFFRKSKLHKEGLNCMSMLFATMCMIIKL